MITYDVWIYDFHSSKTLFDFLNEKGEQGWKVCGMIPETNHGRHKIMITAYKEVSL
jgi:hypothetical protein